MEFEIVGQKEAEHMRKLVDKISIAIEETDCTYKEVIHVLDCIRSNYVKKGCGLLDNTSIQKVAAFGGILD